MLPVLPRYIHGPLDSGDVAGCVVVFYEEPSATGWGSPPAPGVGDGWVWNGYRYNGSPALADWEATYIEANTEPVAGLAAGTLETHAAARVLFEGFLNEISANGYRVRDASGYGFRCTAGNGGWECPSGDPDDRLSRVSAIKDGATSLAAYTYLGGGTVIRIDYTEPDVMLDLWGGTSGTFAVL